MTVRFIIVRSVINESEDEGQIGSAVRKDDPAFNQEITDTLNAMKDDGTLKKILEGFGLSENFVGKEEGKTTNK